MNIAERNLLENLYLAGGETEYWYKREDKKANNSDTLKAEGLLDFDKTRDRIWLTNKGKGAAKRLLKHHEN